LLNAEGGLKPLYRLSVKYAMSGRIFNTTKPESMPILLMYWWEYTPHQRLDNLLEADLLKEAVDKSYAKAGKSIEEQTQGISVSGQTELNIVRRFNPEKIELKEEPLIKREALV
ncbi:MAG: hypothetical protein QM399_08545, partial [Bacillota bacterium]|nr:hypothetical protein [Bacillota bacterium]